jgi:phage shock protein PspC (stress-responsive transcriptional regulator)
MSTSQVSFLARDDTMFGVCEAIGEDFGFNPFYLRVLLAFLIFWNPVVVISAYIVAGVAIAALRWMVPNAPATPA